jgi:hypothetical protein
MYEKAVVRCLDCISGAADSVAALTIVPIISLAFRASTSTEFIPFLLEIKRWQSSNRLAMRPRQAI